MSNNTYNNTHIISYTASIAVCHGSLVDHKSILTWQKELVGDCEVVNKFSLAHLLITGKYFHMTEFSYFKRL